MTTKLFQVLALIAIFSSPAMAGLSLPMDVQIGASRKKLAEERSHQNDTTIVTKEIVYKVTLESHSFTLLTNLEIKYMIFYVDPQPGSTEKPPTAFHKGVEKMAGLGASQSATFETESFKLTTEDLDAGWGYASGAVGRSQDRVTGVWIRVYSAGQLVGEYVNPPTTSSKNTWKD